jgi:hypothetical protein
MATSAKNIATAKPRNRFIRNLHWGKPAALGVRKPSRIETRSGTATGPQQTLWSEITHRPGVWSRHQDCRFHEEISSLGKV